MENKMNEKVEEVKEQIEKGIVEFHAVPKENYDRALKSIALVADKFYKLGIAEQNVLMLVAATVLKTVVEDLKA